MKYLIPILAILFSSCISTKKCGTKMPKEIIELIACPDHDFEKTIKVKAYSMDRWMVINPLTFDTINQMFEGTGLKFELVSIVPTFLDFDIDLRDSRNDQQLEETYLQPAPDSIDIMLYYLPSSTNLEGYALVSDIQTIKEGNGKKEVFVKLNAGAGIIGHEFGHKFSLDDNINGHCSDVMSYSACGIKFVPAQKDKIKGFFREVYLKIKESF